MLNRNPSNKELRNFGILFSVFLCIFFGVILLFIFKKQVDYVYWTVPAAIILLLALVLPKALKYLFLLWMSIALVIGKINTTIILSFTYFIVLTPVALFLKIIGKDFMDRKYDKELKSYRIDTEQKDTNHMENPY